MDLALAAKYLLLGSNCNNCEYFKYNRYYYTTEEEKHSHNLEVCVFTNGRGNQLPGIHICKYWSKYE